MSTMAKYDPDRLAALAAGSLDPAEAAAFEAEIAADPRAAAELAAQRLALDAIRRAPAPVLSAAERADLRRAVAAALHLEDSPEPSAVVAARRRLPWRPLAVAAAALAALVAAVPLFGLLSTGDDAATRTTIALSATTMAREGSVATSGADGLEGFGVESGGPTSAATTLGATAPEIASSDERVLNEAGKAVADLVADPAPLFGSAPAGTVPCGDEARILLEADDPRGMRLDWGGDQLAVWFLSADGATVQRLVAFRPATCEFLAAYP
jgi:hypothetical protein